MKATKLLLIAAMAFSVNSFAEMKKDVTQAVDAAQQRVKLSQNFAKPETVEKATNHAEKTAEKHLEKAKKSAKVNINTADLATLQTLNGIGEVKAKAIIEYRQKHGKIKNAKELENVSGIGQATVEKIRAEIRF